MALVMLHTIVAYLIDNLTAVGRGCTTADATHSPQGLRRHQVAVQLDILSADVHVTLCFCLDSRSCEEHSHEEYG